MKGYVLIIGTLTVIISVLITLNIFFQQSLQMDIAEQFNKQQLLLARSISENLSGLILSLQQDIGSLAHVLSRMNVSSERDFKSLTGEFHGHEGKIKTHIGFLDTGGRLLFYEGSREAIRPTVPEIMEKGRTTAVGKVRVIGTSPTIYVLSPLYNMGEFKGIVFLSVGMNEMATHFIDKINAGNAGYVSILDKTGTLLYHSTQPEMVGRNIYKADKTCFKCHANFNIEKSIVEEREKDYGRYIAPSGEDKIFAFSVADRENLGWIVAASAPSEVTYATKESMKLYSYLIISILTTTIAVSALLIIFNKKRIQAQEIERRQEEMQKYAVELEDKVNERTGELSEEKEKLNTILGAIGGGIVLFDKEGRVQWTNQMIRDMAGMDITGRTCEDFCDECHISGSYSQDNLETVILANLFGQTGKYFQVTTAPVKGEDGEAHGFIRLIQDVTEIKKMEEQMTNSEKLASIGRLAAGIAHEIGNPLTSVFSFVQILKEIEQDEFKKESLQTIHFHINRISEILKQLSGFTKMPMGEARECQLNDTIETSVTLIQYDKRAKDITIKKELSPSLPMITIDCNQLSQVFVNLILNAIDAMHDGGTLTVRSFLRGDDIVMQFQDTGIGIPPGNLIKIFDPFYTTKEKGTGLGLAVSYNIVKKLNGTLTVESEVGKGTVFTITLPVSKAEQVTV